MNTTTSHDTYIERAMALAAKAEAMGEVPVGALLVQEGEVIAEAHNQPIAAHDPCAHAEILTLRKAGQHLQNYRLLNTTLYVTLEPCAMCATAIVHARVSRVVFGAYDPKAGAAGSVFNLLQHPRLNHHVDLVPGVLEEQCRLQLQRFFQRKR